MVQLNDIQIVSQRGHIEVYKDGNFWFSEDSVEAAEAEIQAVQEAAVLSKAV